MPQIHRLKIIDLDTDGRGLARDENNLVIFIKGAVPGDEIEAEITNKKKNYAEAKLLEVLNPSRSRTQPRCGHFGTCNGCKTQNLNYDEQLRIKKQYVINVFERIGGFQNLEIPDLKGGENIYFYRNKLEFSFSNNGWLTEEELSRGESTNLFTLGYHMPNFIDKVLDINKCHLQSEISNKIMNFTKEFFKMRNTSVYSFTTHSGYLRYLVIRNSLQGAILVNLITSYDDKVIDEYAENLKREVPEVSTLTNSIATTKAQAAIGDYYKTIFGSGFIEENSGEYKFKITPNIFFQTNSFQTKPLFDTVVDFAQFEGNENVLDLYCGCGAISIYISKLVKKVTGIDSNKEAIVAANENSDMNKIPNCEFFCFDAKDYLNDLRFRPGGGSYPGNDTVILDPPRSGIHPKAAKYLLELSPPKIIYVSCNPSTQARDLKLLAVKYDITAVQAVDMFPHTMHVENVVRLDLKTA